LKAGRERRRHHIRPAPHPPVHASHGPSVKNLLNTTHTEPNRHTLDLTTPGGVTLKHCCIVAAVVVGAGALLLSGCRIGIDEETSSPEPQANRIATASNAASPPLQTTVLRLGAVDSQEWGNVSALRVGAGIEQPSRARVRVLVRMCFLSSDAYGLMSPTSLNWTLSDNTRRSYTSRSRSRVGRPQPMYRAESGPMRVGTCYMNLIGFALPTRSALKSVTYAATQGASATWTIPSHH
jgi:hypothetical protein